MSEHDHWQDLAEQLGLQAEATPPPPPARTPVALPTPEVRSAPRREEERHPPPAEETTPVRGHGRRGEPEAEPAPHLEEVAASTQSALPAAPAVARLAVDQEETSPGPRQRRGRRSGRSSGRSSRGRAEEPAVETAPKEGEPTPEGAAEKSDERPRRRGRGRPRPARVEPEEETLEPAASAEDETEETPEVVEDADKDDIDTLSDWNVPSWAELIASLYRPER